MNKPHLLHANRRSSVVYKLYEVILASFTLVNMALHLSSRAVGAVSVGVAVSDLHVRVI